MDEGGVISSNEEHTESPGTLSKANKRRAPGILRSGKIVVLGSMTKMPVAGVVWQTMQYVVGFKRLGYDVYYVEAHARTPSMFSEEDGDDASEKAAAFVERVMRRFDLADRWAFHALHAGGRVYGLSDSQLKDLYASAALLINLHGGTKPLPEHYATDRLVYLGTDPVELEIELYDGVQSTLDFLAAHCAFFTFGENYGNADCKVPVYKDLDLKPTRQPVIVDFWNHNRQIAGTNFTTVGNWRQPWREVRYQGELFHWSKHLEFLKFIDLPRRTSQSFELALSSYEENDKQMLEARGWQVRPALEFSMNQDAYRDYILESRGEFTVAKDQNVRLRSGWFSDRSASYLAGGRPVITQETGFSNILPTGSGLFGFSTMDEILGAVEAINSDYARHSCDASEIAREYFSYDRVLTRLLEDVGMERENRRSEPSSPRLPYGACRVRVKAALPSELPAESVVKVDCIVENLGTRDFVSAQPYPVHISYQWIDPATGLPLEGVEGRRTALAGPLAPHRPQTYSVHVQALKQSGEFNLRLTLVQEHVAWFSDLNDDNACTGRVRIVDSVAARDPSPVMMGKHE